MEVPGEILSYISKRSKSLAKIEAGLSARQWETIEKLTEKEPERVARSGTEAHEFDRRLRRVGK